MVRGLSFGVSIRPMLRREVVTGLLIGVSLAMAFIPIGLTDRGPGRGGGGGHLDLCRLRRGRRGGDVASRTSDRLGYDPAFGSGPLATVIQDLLSILIYFGVAMAPARVITRRRLVSQRSRLRRARRRFRLPRR